MMRRFWQIHVLEVRDFGLQRDVLNNLYTVPSRNYLSGDLADDKRNLLFPECAPCFIPVEFAE